MVAATARWLAAYAERHCGSYRATWWVHAGTEPGMRADLVDLGLRLGWVRRDEAEEQSFTKVIDRLSHEGESILLIYDSAIDANTLKPYSPRGGRPMYSLHLTRVPGAVWLCQSKSAFGLRISAPTT